MISIELCIKDDGTMYVSQTEKEDSVEETGEGKIAVQSLDEALAMIQQIASESGLGAPSMPEVAQEQESQAMEQGFRR